MLEGEETPGFQTDSLPKLQQSMLNRGKSLLSLPLPVTAVAEAVSSPSHVASKSILHRYTRRPRSVENSNHLEPTLIQHTVLLPNGPASPARNPLAALAYSEAKERPTQ